jgi:energy-coupling factor transport system permease protein
MCADPIVLGAVCVAILAAGAAAGCGRELGRSLRLALGVAAAVIVVNALVTRDGLTVIWRIGEVPLLGQTDVTLEAGVYGGVLGLRAAALILCGVLYTVAVDPDEVLRMMRRVSYRSALSATLATRLVPLLARDARRLADAQRCRPGRPPSRVALLRATSSGVLDRALDVAAALEVRGYAGARRAVRARRPLSRQDLAFAVSALAIAVGAVGGRIAGWTAMRAYPLLHVPAGPGTWACAAGVLVAALAPFLVRRGVG